MKFWTTGILMTLGVLFPTLAFGQGPWGASGAPAAGYYDPAFAGGGYPGVYDQLLPERNGLDPGDSQFRLLSFREAFAESYLRLDYLHWNISGGDGTLLGAPVSSSTPGLPPPDLSGRDRNNLLPANDPVTGSPPLTYAIVPRLGDAFDTLNGLRGTIGIPTNLGTLESEVFYFEQASNTLSIDPYIDTQTPFSTSTIIPATTLFNNGSLSPNRMIVYNDGYSAAQKTTFWGAEANWIFNPTVPNTGLEISPILGFRYLGLDDSLTIAGRNIQSSSVTLNHMISSLARNHIFGPQIGLRADTMLGPYLEIGVETKFLAGINSMDQSVRTSEIFNPTTSSDPTQATELPFIDEDHRTRFAPVFDLALTGKLQLSPHFKLFASYEFLLGGGFSRAFKNINYDSPASVTSPPTIRYKSDLQEFMAHGFAVGGEFVFR